MPTPPKQAPKAAPKAAPQDPAPAQPQASGEGEHNPFVHSLLEQAASLATEKERLFERIGANRDTLRTVAKTGLLSEEQVKAIQEWYPVRQVKKGDDAPADAPNG